MRCRQTLLAFILAVAMMTGNAAPASLVPLSEARSPVAIVLVGGLYKNFLFFKEWKPWLDRGDVSVYGFDDDFRALTLNDSSWHLAVGLTALVDEGKTDLIVIAHSLGGLVAKHALGRMERQGILSRLRVELHAMGSPWGGSWPANLVPWLPFHDTVLRLIGYPMVIDIGSESAFMRELDSRLPPSARLFLYEGSRDTVARPATAATRARYRSIAATAASTARLDGATHDDFRHPFMVYFDY